MKEFMKFVKVFVIGIMMFGLVGCSTNEKAEIVTDENVEVVTDEKAETVTDEETTDENEAFINVVDCAGREVKVSKNVEKVVDLTMFDGLRTMIQLDAKECLVGVSDWGYKGLHFEPPFTNSFVIVEKVAPELKEIENVGSGTEPNVEKIMAADPDVILVEWSAKDIADSLQLQINVPVVCVGEYGNSNYDSLRILGKILGKEDRANELIEFAENKTKIVTDVTSKIAEDDKKSVFYWSHPFVGSPKTNGSYSAFELAGGRNVGFNGEETPKGLYDVTKEQILAWNPDYIFKHSPFTCDVEGWHTVETIKEDIIVQETKAVKDNNVYPTKGEMLGIDCVTELTEVFYIAKILYPDEFVDLDVEKEGNEILEKFYGSEELYTEMCDSIGLYNWENE